MRPPRANRPGQIQPSTGGSGGGGRGSSSSGGAGIFGVGKVTGGGFQPGKDIVGEGNTENEGDTGQSQVPVVGHTDPTIGDYQPVSPALDSIFNRGRGSALALQLNTQRDQEMLKHQYDMQLRDKVNSGELSVAEATASAQKYVADTNAASALAVKKQELTNALGISSDATTQAALRAVGATDTPENRAALQPVIAQHTQNALKMGQQLGLVTDQQNFYIQQHPEFAQSAIGGQLTAQSAINQQRTGQVVSPGQASEAEPFPGTGIGNVYGIGGRAGGVQTTHKKTIDPKTMAQTETDVTSTTSGTPGYFKGTSGLNLNPDDTIPNPVTGKPMVYPPKAAMPPQGDNSQPFNTPMPAGNSGLLNGLFGSQGTPLQPTVAGDPAASLGTAPTTPPINPAMLQGLFGGSQQLGQQKPPGYLNNASGLGFLGQSQPTSGAGSNQLSDIIKWLVTKPQNTQNMQGSGLGFLSNLTPDDPENREIPSQFPGGNY